jgi:hypothetical protein
MAWLLPDGGPFRVPGADGVFGFGLGASVEGPGTGEAPSGMGGTLVGTAENEGVAILVVSGHQGPEYVGCIFRLWYVRWSVPVIRFVACRHTSADIRQKMLAVLAQESQAIFRMPIGLRELSGR